MVIISVKYNNGLSHIGSKILSGDVLMGDNDLRILYDAEKKAKQKVADARKWAEKAMRNTETAISQEREKRIAKFRSTMEARIKETEEKSLMESRKIRENGLTIAQSLKDEARQRIPASVEKVLEHFREE